MLRKWKEKYKKVGIRINIKKTVYLSTEKGTINWKFKKIQKASDIRSSSIWGLPSPKT